MKSKNQSLMKKRIKQNISLKQNIGNIKSDDELNEKEKKRIENNKNIKENN